ncbi:hypothetical protein [Proteus myxofaciens]|uniref:CpmK family protein n=1 Tax=Proteus myxofaciens ATCC 19692 TaxID=1354337 RepID=A0A198GMJ5_9GAMM|nr:hypothetical protein [Proteus myxofaciens]OAT37416.1 CpmK family protein [Proteus myxofaciens ATCC 19692]
MKSISLSLILLLLSTFSWANDDDEGKKVDEYKTALQAFFNSDYLLCLGEGKWPVYSNENDAPWVLERMHALMKAGLIEQTENGDEWVFNLSEKGRKAWQPYQDFCYGHLFISQIKEIQPIDSGKSKIYFYYGVKDIPNWANNAEIQSAFSELDIVLNGINRELYQLKVEKLPDNHFKVLSYPVPIE